MQIDLIGKKVFTSSCDVAKSFLTRRGVPYENVAALRVRSRWWRWAARTSAVQWHRPEKADRRAEQGADSPILSVRGERRRLSVQGRSVHGDYPAGAALCILVIYVTMVYGPIAALLVEMFPTRIRYTSMRLPYHIGNGWFGGFLPPTAFGMVAATGNIYNGLWYPMAVAAMTVIGGPVPAGHEGAPPDPRRRGLISPACRRIGGRRLEHDQEKWEPVFLQNCA